MWSNMQNIKKLFEKEEEEFVNFFPEVTKRITVAESNIPGIELTANSLKKSLEYNVSRGRKRRAMFAVFVFLYYRQNSMSEKDFEQARVLGWSMELLQGCFVVADDIMDKSLTRRGKVCWCRMVRHPSHAINDVLHLENATFDLLDTAFKNEPCYKALIGVIRELEMLTLAGQQLDLSCASSKEVDFSGFTRKTYNRIVKYKTAFYTFYLPAAAAMTAAGITDPKIFKEARDVLIKMGEFFQIQDDYLDLYGHPDVIGKIGSDIQDNKCCWPIVAALEIASDEQKKILKENYGSWDEGHVRNVKAVFSDLDIEGVYRKYENATYKDLTEKIDAMDSKTLPTPIFKIYLDNLFKRSK